MNILIGTDPELFAVDNKTGKFVSGHDMIPGTKMFPHFVECGAVQVDGVACEFNTNPAETLGEFMGNIKTVRSILDKMVAESGAHLVSVPTATFDLEYFETLPEDVKLLGCMPDFNAYTGDENIPPHTDEPFRTGGFHLHVGWDRYLDPTDPEHFGLCRNVIKQLDAVLFDTSKRWDNDDARRKLYGNRGAFRPKTYGVEYRSLSNACLSDEAILEWIYVASTKAIELLFEEDVHLWTDLEGEDTEWYLEKHFGIPQLKL